jgi:hypothetical protein
MGQPETSGNGTQPANVYQSSIGPSSFPQKNIQQGPIKSDLKKTSCGI